jgi:hypothetical protein
MPIAKNNIMLLQERVYENNISGQGCGGVT